MGDTFDKLKSTAKEKASDYLAGSEEGKEGQEGTAQKAKEPTGIPGQTRQEPGGESAEAGGREQQAEASQEGQAGAGQGRQAGATGPDEGSGISSMGQGGPEADWEERARQAGERTQGE